jgi:hypothetical protein
MSYKASIRALQEIDCNCNNCAFMERDLAEYEKWRVFHFDMQQQMFGARKAKAIDDAQALVSSNPIEANVLKSYNLLLQKALDMVFVFEKNIINYGNCTKLGKPVSFIPNTCQIETQSCFVHR